MNWDRKKKNFSSELLLLDLQEEEGEESEETARELEARMIGNRILELAGNQPVWDKTIKSYRPAQFGDIVILLRTITGGQRILQKYWEKWEYRYLPEQETDIFLLRRFRQCWHF